MRNASITSLPLAAGEVAGLDLMIFMLGVRLDDLLEALLAVDRRRRAQRALQLDDVPPLPAVFVASQRRGLRPSSTKSDPMNVT